MTKIVAFLQVSKLLDILKPGVLRRLRADIDQTPSASNIEIQIPVSLTSDQAEFYKQVLSKFYDVLVDPNTHRLSSSRASQSRTICDELRKVIFLLSETCSHYLTQLGCVFPISNVIIWFWILGFQSFWGAFMFSILVDLSIVNCS